MNIGTASLLSRILLSFMIIFLGIIINKFLRLILNRSKNISPNTILKFKKRNSTIIKVISTALIIPIWFYNSKEILTFLGLFSAGLAFALRDVLANFLGFSIINSHSIYKIGDRIILDNVIGDVIKIDWFHTTVLEIKKIDSNYGQSTGRTILIPNIKILTEKVLNERSTFPYTWNEITFTLDMDSDWKQAKEIILEAADIVLGDYTKELNKAIKDISKDYPIYYNNINHIIYTSFLDDKIILNLRFMCKSKNFRNIQHSIIEYYLENREGEGYVK